MRCFEDEACLWHCFSEDKLRDLLTITIPYLASGSLTKDHRAGSNYKKQAECQKSGTLRNHQGEGLRKIIQNNYPKDQWGGDKSPGTSQGAS
jgi:hypothetical protein